MKRFRDNKLVTILSISALLVVGVTGYRLVTEKKTGPLNEVEQEHYWGTEPRHLIIESLATTEIQKAFDQKNPERLLETFTPIYREALIQYLTGREMQILAERFKSGGGNTPPNQALTVLFSNIIQNNQPDSQVSRIAVNAAERFAIAQPELAASWFVNENINNRVCGRNEWDLKMMAQLMEERGDTFIPFARALAVDIQPKVDAIIADVRSRI